MTQEEIIEMARQAELTKTIDCCGVANKFCSQDQWRGNLSIFAKLVAQHEREACAQILANTDLSGLRDHPLQNWVAGLLFEFIKAIRARGRDAA